MQLGGGTGTVTINVKRYAYDAPGNVRKVWGSGTYPVQYTYDDYGRKTGMRTWRDDASIDWNAATWPNPAGGDLIQWHYYPDAASSPFISSNF